MNKIKFQILEAGLPAIALQRQVQAGFSLIELLVVAAIITTLLSIGVSALVTYSNVQVFNSKVSELATTLETAKTYAQSQVKKCPVDTHTFVGYSVSISTSTTYSLNNICRDGLAAPVSTSVDTKTLRASLTVGSVGTVVTFNVLTGSASGGSIIMTGYGRCQTISINPAGNITIGDVRFTCP